MPKTRESIPNRVLVLLFLYTTHRFALGFPRALVSKRSSVSGSFVSFLRVLHEVQGLRKVLLCCLSLAFSHEKSAALVESDSLGFGSVEYCGVCRKISAILSIYVRVCMCVYIVYTTHYICSICTDTTVHKNVYLCSFGCV